MCSMCMLISQILKFGFTKNTLRMKHFSPNEQINSLYKDIILLYLLKYDKNSFLVEVTFQYCFPYGGSTETKLRCRINIYKLTQKI